MYFSFWKPAHPKPIHLGIYFKVDSCVFRYELLLQELEDLEAAGRFCPQQVLWASYPL